MPGPPCRIAPRGAHRLSVHRPRPGSAWVPGTSPGMTAEKAGEAGRGERIRAAAKARPPHPVMFGTSPGMTVERDGEGRSGERIRAAAKARPPHSVMPGLVPGMTAERAGEAGRGKGDGLPRRLVRSIPSCSGLSRAPTPCRAGSLRGARTAFPAAGRSPGRRGCPLESVRLRLERSSNRSRWTDSHFRAGVCQQQPDTR